MEIKSVVRLEVEKGEHTFTFDLPAGASYGAAYDAVFECLQEILDMASKAKDQAAPQKPEEAVVEDIK